MRAARSIHAASCALTLALPLLCLASGCGEGGGEVKGTGPPPTEESRKANEQMIKDMYEKQKGGQNK